MHIIGRGIHGANYSGLKNLILSYYEKLSSISMSMNLCLEILWGVIKYLTAQNIIIIEFFTPSLASTIINTCLIIIHHSKCLIFHNMSVVLLYSHVLVTTNTHRCCRHSHVSSAVDVLFGIINIILSCARFSLCWDVLCTYFRIVHFISASFAQKQLGLFSMLQYCTQALVVVSNRLYPAKRMYSSTLPILWFIHYTC